MLNRFVQFLPILGINGAKNYIGIVAGHQHAKIRNDLDQNQTNLTFLKRFLSIECYMSIECKFILNHLYCSCSQRFVFLQMEMKFDANDSTTVCTVHTTAAVFLFTQFE